jgi:hypothetical protein
MFVQSCFELDFQESFAYFFRVLNRGQKMSKLTPSVLVLVVMMFHGCTGSRSGKRTAESPTPPTQNAANMPNEDFDPLTLKEPELQIPAKPRITQNDATPVITSANVDTSLVQVVGYQVQILQTEDADLARAAVRDAAAVLSTAVAFVFDSPYFKVRAGNFVNRYDAEQLQELALSKSYASAWVVRTMVKVRASELERQ